MVFMLGGTGGQSNLFQENKETGLCTPGSFF